ncbi:MAG: DNA polymerase III subunit beta [Chlamydiota bacterium]|nr:DNA polymerase III subunit beta [Chlamydiota bacterium]
MRLKISSQTLLSMVKRIMGVVPNRPALPILNHFLLECQNHQVTLSAGWGTTLSTFAQEHIEEEGAVALPARHFFELIRELRSPDIEIIKVGEGDINITSGSSQFHIKGVQASEFPPIGNLTGAPSLSLSASLLKSLFSRVSFAAAKEESRQVLNGVLMQLTPDQITLTATDGKRLARTQHPLKCDIPHVYDYLIPLKAVEEAIKIADGEENISLHLLTDQMALKTEDTLLMTQLMAGSYPQVDRVIPEPLEHPIHLHCEELMSLLKQVSLFTQDRQQAVLFTFKPHELLLTSGTRDIGEGRVHLPVNYEGPEVTLAFNPLFFYDILRHCQDESVPFSFTSPHHPGLITDSSHSLFVIMPMRLPSLDDTPKNHPS